MATKPSGLPKASNVKTMPIKPIGMTLTTRKRRLKLWSWAIRKNSISSSNKPGKDIGWELYRAPVEDFDQSQADQDEAAAQECIEASRPAELRPHVRAVTEPRK